MHDVVQGRRPRRFITCFLNGFSGLIMLFQEALREVSDELLSCQARSFPSTNGVRRVAA